MIWLQLKFWKCSIFYNGAFGCNGSVLFWLVHFFCMIHSIGAINVCTNFEINRYKIDEFRRHVYFIWRHVTQKLYVVHHGAKILLNIWKPTRSLYEFPFKSYGSNSGFHDFGDLHFWPMFYSLSHALGRKYWNLHAKFHKNMSSITGWYALGHTHKTYTNTHRR